MRYNFKHDRQAIEYGRVDEKIFSRISDDAGIVPETLDDLSADPEQDKSKYLLRSQIEGLGFDAYNALLKFSPKVKNSTDPLITEIIDRMMRDDHYASLRASTVGDDLASAVGACGLVRHIVTNLPEDLRESAKEESRRDEEATQAENEAKAMRSALDDGDDEIDPEEVESMESHAKDKRQQADKAAQALSNRIASHGKSIGQVVAKAVSKAGEDAGAISAAGKAFGLGNAEIGKGLPVEEKFRLAKIIQQHGKRFTDLVNLIGRIQATAQRKQAEKMHHEGGEIVDLTQGDDIGLLIDDEIALLRNPIFGRLQQSRLMDAGLDQFEVETREPKAKGDIVILLDESGSMNGQNDAEAKAVTLAIAHIAIKQKRNLIVHFFQYDVTHTVRLNGADSTANGIELAMRGLGEIASRGTGGGTNFDRPLQRAIETAKDLREPDIIAITDGHASVTDETLSKIEQCKKLNGLNIFAMLIGRTGSAPEVEKFADRVWCADSLLNKAAPELFEMI